MKKGKDLNKLLREWIAWNKTKESYRLGLNINYLRELYDSYPKQSIFPR